MRLESGEQLQGPKGEERVTNLHTIRRTDWNFKCPECEGRGFCRCDQCGKCQGCCAFQGCKLPSRIMNDSEPPQGAENATQGVI
jgi:hypothetical protein